MSDNWIIPATWECWGKYEIPKSEFPTLAAAVAHSYTLALPQQGEYVDDSLQIDWEGIALHNDIPEEEVQQIGQQ
jgi:hypothetical protein